MMSINADNPRSWKADIAQSVDHYNDWFMEFAPRAYRDTRVQTTDEVESALERTNNLTNITPDLLRTHPSVLPMLRMSTAPPIARDRLIGLAGVSPNLVDNMEKQQRVPPKMDEDSVADQLQKIGDIILRLADPDIFTWLLDHHAPTEVEVRRAATIVADRLCGAQANPIIRNAQEQRQLAVIRAWLEARGYSYVAPGEGITFDTLTPGKFAFRLNVPVGGQSGRQVNIPVDVAIRPLSEETDQLPILIEAKSAGDFTNTNKRRKEEAQKINQLHDTYGADVRYFLFLCGYFDSGYLGYEAAEGIDWVWEHRVDDLERLGL